MLKIIIIFFFFLQLSSGIRAHITSLLAIRPERSLIPDDVSRRFRHIVDRPLTDSGIC